MSERGACSIIIIIIYLSGSLCLGNAYRQHRDQDQINRMPDVVQLTFHTCRIQLLAAEAFSAANRTPDISAADPLGAESNAYLRVSRQVRSKA